MITQTSSPVTVRIADRRYVLSDTGSGTAVHSKWSRQFICTLDTRKPGQAFRWLRDYLTP